MINVYDNFFNEEDYNFISDYCLKSSYFYGEGNGDPNSPFDPTTCTGLVHEVYYHTEANRPSECSYQIGGGPVKTLNQKRIFNLFSQSIEKKFPKYKSTDIIRIYINCFAKSESSHYHTDAEDNVGTTFLFYPNKKWELNDGGETQFFIDDNIYGIIPIPNRMIFFDANLLHKATPFRDRHRFSIAIKYNVQYSSQ